MLTTENLRRYLTEFFVVFLGVALAFAVENFREGLNEKAVGEQYLSRFREDLQADLLMLDAQIDIRSTQLANALTVLEFFDGRPATPQQFFEAYYPVLPMQATTPNRNTMDEVLSSGSLRLIRDAEIRAKLLDLYASYEGVRRHEEHMDRDFDVYLYDTTFSKVQLDIEGPWEDTQENRQAVEALLSDLRVENGIRLVVINLDDFETALIPELEEIRLQVEELLQMIPVE